MPTDDKPPETTPAAGGGDGEFWEDSGPEFNPETSPESPELEQLNEQGEAAGWTPEGVVEFLEGIQAPAFNAVLNPLVLGVEDVDWSHRHTRLLVVAPAIAREWNKMPRVRSLAGHTDRGLILSYMLLEYLAPRAFDVVAERKAIAAAARAEADAAGYESPTGFVVEQPAAQEQEPAADPESDINNAGPRVAGLPARRIR